MTDAWLLVVSAVLVVTVPFDWYVAYRLTFAAWVKPRSQTLNLAAGRSIAIAVAATIAGFLGMTTIYFNVTGVRVLPQPLPAILIAIALIVISLPNVYALRLLRQWDASWHPSRRGDDHL